MSINNICKVFHSGLSLIITFFHLSFCSDCGAVCCPETSEEERAPDHLQGRREGQCGQLQRRGRRRGGHAGLRHRSASASRSDGGEQTAAGHPALRVALPSAAAPQNHGAIPRERRRAGLYQPARAGKRRQPHGSPLRLAGHLRI